jgi:hypothetical protein
VKDQPVVRVAAERLGHDLLEFRLDLVDVLPRSEASAVAYSKDVGVDRERLFAKGGVEDHVGGLAPDTGQLLQFLAGARDLAAVIADQRLR